MALTYDNREFCKRVRNNQICRKSKFRSLKGMTIFHIPWLHLSLLSRIRVESNGGENKITKLGFIPNRGWLNRGRTVSICFYLSIYFKYFIAKPSSRLTASTNVLSLYRFQISCTVSSYLILKMSLILRIYSFLKTFNMLSKFRTMVCNEFNFQIHIFLRFFTEQYYWKLSEQNVLL